MSRGGKEMKYTLAIHAKGKKEKLKRLKIKLFTPCSWSFVKPGFTCFRIYFPPQQGKNTNQIALSSMYPVHCTVYRLQAGVEKANRLKLG